MGKTSIEYADQVSNPLMARLKGTNLQGFFCEKPDPQGTCKNCWAEAYNRRFGNMLAYSRENRDKVEWFTRPQEMTRLKRLNDRKLMSEKFPGNPLIVFTNDTYDLFQPSITDEQRDWVFDEYDRLTNLTLLIQSTYVSRMSRYLSRRYIKTNFMPRHYVIGMSAGTQKFYDTNIEYFLRVPACRKYVICEPLLERIQLHTTFFDLLIIGGESGAGARPCYVEWIQELVYDAKGRGLAVLVKQLGTASRVFNANALEWPKSPSFVSYGEDGYASADVRLSSYKGNDMSEWPTDLRIREFSTRGFQFRPARREP